MKRLLPALIVLLSTTGCVQYAGIEQTRMGMTVNELRMIDTPCYFRGESGEKILYNCQFSVPTGPYSNERTIKPYILTFEDDRLTEIALDEQELDRQRFEDGLYYQHRFYYPYGYHFYYGGYPYWYP